MSIDKILVLLGAVAGIVATYWFFLMKKESAVIAGKSIHIAVKGGYNPSVIKLKKDTTTTLIFTRTDESSCLEEIVIPAFKKKVFLPLHRPVSIKLTPDKAGEFEMVCGMNMFHGKLIVRNK